MSTNIIKNLNTIRTGTQLRHQLKLKFKNGKENTVYMYPRAYVNLANKYINTKSLAPYLIPRNSLNLNGSSPANKNRAENLLKKNYVIVQKFWPAWVNKNFKFEVGETVKRMPAIKAFVEKTKREQQTPRVTYVNGKYVGLPTMRNRAAYVVERIRVRGTQNRVAKLKEALKHAANFSRKKKHWSTGAHLHTPRRFNTPSLNKNNLGF